MPQRNIGDHPESCFRWYLLFRCGDTILLDYQHCGRHFDSLEENERCLQNAVKNTGENHLQHYPLPTPQLCAACSLFWYRYY
jgi:hypothetical protein